MAHLAAHLRFPRSHWRRIRHTGLIERTFRRARRRVKVMGRLPGERLCLCLVCAALERAAGGWRGVTVTPSACAYSRRFAASSSRRRYPTVAAPATASTPTPRPPAPPDAAVKHGWMALGRRPWLAA